MLNSLFNGGDQADDDDDPKQGKEEAFLSKLNRQDRKKAKRQLAKDKITTRDARVLTGGMTVAENATLSNINKVNPKSKKIKKSGGAHEITREQVMDKLKKRRMAVSTLRLNK